MPPLPNLHMAQKPQSLFPLYAISRKHPFLARQGSSSYKRFITLSASQPPSGGYWRDTLPPPQEMQNGRWAGKGRSWIFSQVMETLVQASQRDCGWKRMRADIKWREESARRQREWEAKGAPESGSGGFDEHAFHKHQWKDEFFKNGGFGRRRGHGGPTGMGCNNRRQHGHGHPQAQQGTGPGPFDPNAFKREHWRATMGWRHGSGRHKHHHDHHHRRNCLPVDRVVMRARLARYKTGLFYFLQKECPQHPKESKRTVLPRRQPNFPSPAASYFANSSANSLSQHSRSYSSSPTFSPFTSRQRDAEQPPRMVAHHHKHNSLFETAVLRLPVLCNLQSAGGSHVFSFAKMFGSAITAMKKARGSEHCCYKQSGLPVLWPLVTILKSSAALNAVTWASRIALTLLPLSIRGKIIHVIKQRYFENPEGNAWIKKMVEMRGPATPNGITSHINAKIVLPVLLLMPVVLLGATVVASYERTPVTGRPRIVMLSPSEENDLVSNILSLGTGTQIDSPHRDWVAILRNVLQLPDEGVSSTTGRRILLGGEVLDDRDWRVRWTQAVLVALEAGVPSLADEASADFQSDGILNPPPTKFPLKARPTGLDGLKGQDMKSLVADYDLLVLDRQESNAFSFGFGPDEADIRGYSKGKKGVIVVYSGFIDEILGRSPTQAIVEQGSASNGLFGSFLSSRRPAPSVSNETPDVMPTPEQTKSLAVLLSHELAHLILSHTLESYASTSVLIPHVSKMLSDVARTLLFPITAMLGPFVNDSVGRMLNTGASEGFGVTHAVNSCESRRLELEADVVALRLLSHSGIDPRHALHFWEDRLVATNQPDPSSVPVSHTATQHLRLHFPANQSPRDKDGNEVDPAFLRSHPVNEERVAHIKRELEYWMSLLSGPGPVHGLQGA